MEERPVGTVRVAGLDPRDLRVIGFVLRHCDFNRYSYRIEAEAGDGPADAGADLVLANRHDPEGARLWARAASLPDPAARIELIPRGAAPTGGDAIAIDRLAVQLLPVLNRVFEQRLSMAASTARAPAEADAGLPERETERLSEELVEQFAEDLADDLADELGDELGDEFKGELQDELSREIAEEFSVDAGAAKAPSASDESGRGLGAEVDSEDGEQAARVLIVDDSATVRRQIGVALDRLGLRHEAVGSAAQALERLAREPFDLALVDVMMPDTDGYRLTREIRRDRRVRHLPVIILTSRSSPFDLARGALAGCDAYLTKPVPFRALEAAVRKQLRRIARGGRRLPAESARAGDMSEAGQGAAPSRLARFLGR